VSRANSEKHANPVDGQPVRISIKTVQHEPAACQYRLQVSFFYLPIYNLDLLIRVELLQAFCRHICLRFAQIGRVEENLAVEVA